MKKYNLCFLIVFFSMTSIAQETTIENKMPIVIKTNITHYISGEAYISCEKYFKKYKFEAGAGMIYPIHYMQRFVGGKPMGINMDDEISFYYGKGFSIRAQYKINLSKNKSHSNLYMSPLIMYKYIWNEKDWIYYPHSEYNAFNGSSYSQLESNKYNVFKTEILFGYEFFINNKILIDYYIGLGGRYRLHNGYVYDKKIDNNNQYVPIVNPYKCETVERVTPSIHLGLNIGFNINK